MITHTRRETVENVNIPNGYTVTRLENRGYDSPDRWFEAHCGKRRIGREFGTASEAVNACIEDALRCK